MPITQAIEPDADGGQTIVVTCDDGATHRFRNRCPHLGIPLDWGDGRCLSDDGTVLVCAMHQAVFDPASGLCLAGPCVGKSLERRA